MRLVFLATLFWSVSVSATYRIGIIDTGLDNEILPVKLKLCDTGHYNFYTDEPGLDSSDPEHGTMVSAIIAYHLQAVDYCAVFMSVPVKPGFAQKTVQAMRMLEDEGLTALNLSFSGNQHFFEEFNALKRMADQGTKIFVAAGNDNKNLDYICNYYPACYHIEGLYIVGSRKSERNWDKAGYSNYGGRIQLWYIGDCPFKDCSASGTSLASPRALSDYLLSLEK